jgi:putative peptide zinc metalloprotease protein
MDDARVVAPQNLAVAANYDCYRCITAAIANQLVLSVPGEPGEDQLHALAAVWNELVRFGQGITSRTLTEITDQLEAFKAEIVQILATAPPVEPAPATSPTDAPTPAAGTPSPADEETTPASEPSPSTDPTTPAPEPTGSGSTTPGPTSTPEGSSTPDATTTPESTPTPEPTPTPDPALAPEPSPVETTSPAP